MITLRGHHLLCMLTYIGKGYTATFTSNMTMVVQAIGAGASFTITTGPDSICQPWIDECGAAGVHCFKADLMAKDADAVDKVARLLGRQLAPGVAISLNRAEIEQLRGMFLNEQQRMLACADCQWNSLCDSVAGSGYQGCVL